jgi:hypothetical protein
MKRTVALRALSAEHHHALVLARRARDGSVDAAAIASAFRHDIAPHFASEEACLLPALERAGAGLLAERTRCEHAALRDAVAALATGGSAAACTRFGLLLDAHVRFEERILFPAAEARLDATTLASIGTDLHADSKGGH